MLQILHEAVEAVRRALDELADWGPSGTRPGQYLLDVAADAAVMPVLHGSGLAVLSEESGLSGPSGSDLLAVVDPVDGSTNAYRGVPFYSTSICVLDATGPLAGVVVNQATGTRYEAVRGSGGRKDGEPLRPSGCTELASAIVGISGFPGIHPGWAQFRAFGAAALELCAVADGTLDAFVVGTHASLAPWDYLGAMLVCTEAGAVVGELEGRDLVTRDPALRRAVVAAATTGLLGQLGEAATAGAGSGPVRPQGSPPPGAGDPVP